MDVLFPSFISVQLFIHRVEGSKVPSPQTLPTVLLWVCRGVLRSAERRLLGLPRGLFWDSPGGSETDARASAAPLDAEALLELLLGYRAPHPVSFWPLISDILSFQS